MAFQKRCDGARNLAGFLGQLAILIQNGGVEDCFNCTCGCHGSGNRLFLFGRKCGIIRSASLNDLLQLVNKRIKIPGFPSCAQGLVQERDFSRIFSAAWAASCHSSVWGRYAPISFSFFCSRGTEISRGLLSFAMAAAAPAAIPVIKQQGITRVEPFISRLVLM